MTEREGLAAVYFCPANTSATFSARATVLACATLDATATTIPAARQNAALRAANFKLRTSNFELKNLGVDWTSLRPEGQAEGRPLLDKRRGGGAPRGT